MADGNVSIAELRRRASEAVRLRKLATEERAKRTHQRIVQRREQLAELEARCEERVKREEDCIKLQERINSLEKKLRNQEDEWTAEGWWFHMKEAERRGERWRGEVDRLEELVRCLDGQITEVISELKETVDSLIEAFEKHEHDRKVINALRASTAYFAFEAFYWKGKALGGQPATAIGF